MRLFVTYSEWDWFYGTQLKDSLRHISHPYEVITYDRGLPDEYWLKGIDDCQMVVFLLSVFSVKERRLAYQINYAYQQQKPLMVIKIDEVSIPTHLPYTTLINGHNYTGAEVGDILPKTLPLMQENDRLAQRLPTPPQFERVKSLGNMIRLKWELDGQTYFERVLLDQPIVLGRSPHNPIVVPSHRISREHAAIYMKGARRYIVNLSQTNHVYVEQHGEVNVLHYDEEMPLDSDAVFRLSDVRFEVLEGKRHTENGSEKTCPLCGQRFEPNLLVCPKDNAPLGYHKIYALRSANGCEIQTAILERPFNLAPEQAFGGSGMDIPPTREAINTNNVDYLSKTPPHSFPPSVELSPDEFTVLRPRKSGQLPLQPSLPPYQPPAPDHPDEDKTALKPLSKDMLDDETAVPTSALPLLDDGDLPTTNLRITQPSLSSLASEYHYPQFTAFYPESVQPGYPYALMVFVHVESAWREIRHIARNIDLNQGTGFGSVYNSLGTPENVPLTIAVHLEGVELSRPFHPVMWQAGADGLTHQAVTFFFHTPDDLKQDIQGYVTVYREAIILGRIPLQMRLVPEGAEAWLPGEARLEKIDPVFACYSDKDTELMDYFQRSLPFLGQQMLMEIYDIRANDRWAMRLLEMIDESHLFQLFWSKHTAISGYCNREWELALELAQHRPNFIQMVWWEANLTPPPPELAGLRPQKIHLPALK